MLTLTSTIRSVPSRRERSIRGYCPHSVQNRYLRGQQGCHITTGMSPGAASWCRLSKGQTGPHSSPQHWGLSPDPACFQTGITSPASPPPPQDPKSSPLPAALSKSGASLGFSEVRAPTKPQEALREFSPSVKGGLNPGFGLRGVAGDLLVLPCCAHTHGSAGRSGGSHPVSTPLWCLTPSLDGL